MGRNRVVIELSNESTRREFCQHVCQLASVAAFGGLVAACGGGPTSPSDIGTSLPVLSGSRTNGVTTVSIGAGSPLAATGGMAFVQAGSANFLVARTGAGSFTALSTICTHQQCNVTNVSGSLFVCPCHGSEYDTSGAVVRGPAPSPLRSFTTSFADPLLTING